MMRSSIRLVAVAAVCLSGVAIAQAAPSFTSGPTAARQADGARISFTVSEPTDVEVAVLNKDGNVVRHLAAGALGANPPAPFKPGLAQSIEWDGRDDQGNPVDKAASFSVRARLGMKVAFGRFVADSPFNFNDTLCRGLAVDPRNGDLYVMGSRAALRFLRVYDRTGKYLREVLPWPADLPARGRDPFGTLALPDGRVVPMNYYSLWPAFYPFGGGLGHDDSKRPEGKLLAFNPADKTLTLTNEQVSAIYRIRSADGSAASDTFSERLWPRDAGHRGSGQCGPATGAWSADGKTLYLTGFAAFPKGGQSDPNFPDGRIFRAVRGGDGNWKVDTLADVPLGPSAPKIEAQWSVSSGKTSLHGMAADSKGRLFVADRSNGKVQVLDGTGKIVGSVDVPDAYCVAVDEKASALYVLTRQTTGKWAKSLVKFDGWGRDARVVQTLELPERGASRDPLLAADFSGPHPQLWVGGVPSSGSVLRIADRDGKLTIEEDLADRGKTAAGYATRMAVDRHADLVYLNDGVTDNLRYNGLTGEYAGKLDNSGRPVPITGSELAIRRDGMLYRLGGTSWQGQITRLTRDLEPPDDDVPDQYGYYYGRMGGGYFGNHGWSVFPDGRLLACGMFDWCQYAIFEFSPAGKPTDRPWLKGFDWKGDFQKAGINSVLIGWLPTQCGGVVAGPGGHVYVGLRVLPRDYELPAVLANATGYTTMIGSVIKFKPTGGAVHPDDGREGGTWKNGPLEMKVPARLDDGIRMGSLRTQHGVTLRQTFIEGGVRAYPGIAPYSGYGRSDACVCQTPRFDVDGYGRIYMPNALTCSVTVMDDAGNRLAQFGQYANFDADVRGGKIPLAYPVAVGVSLKHIYVADSANRRVVRVDPTWSAEKVTPIK